MHGGCGDGGGIVIALDVIVECVSAYAEREGKGKHVVLVSFGYLKLAVKRFVIHSAMVVGMLGCS
mgnify:CR=1 FL=1